MSVYELEGEFDLPLGMVVGAVTPRRGAVDPTIEANYRKDLMASIDKLEELRQKYVDRAIQTMSEDDKAILVALAETMQAIAQGQIAAGMGMQARGQLFQLFRGTMDEVGHMSLAVPDQQAMADINTYTSTFAGSAASAGQSKGFRDQLATTVRNKGGLLKADPSGAPILDANGQTQFNPDAVNAVVDLIENQGGGLNTVANVTGRLLKLDPGTRANTGAEAARLMRAASQDAVRVLADSVPEVFGGLSEQARKQLGDVVGARYSDRIQADIGTGAVAVAKTQQERATNVFDNFVEEGRKIGVAGLNDVAAAEIKAVLQRNYDNYKNGRLGSAAVFNAVNANVPYYDEKIRANQEKIDRLDNKTEPNIHRLADPILRETDRMRAKIPAFDVFQVAMGFPTAERTAIWTSRFPQALKLVNDAAAQNPSLYADPAAVKDLLQRNGYPTTGIERAAWSFKPNQPVLPTNVATAGAPDLSGVAVAEPAAPAAGTPADADARLEALAEAAPPLQGTATVEAEPATRAEALADLQTEGMPDLQGTATKEPATRQEAMAALQAEGAPATPVGETFTGRGGTEYMRNPDGSYTVTKAASPILEGAVVNRDESPELWASIAREHNEAAIAAAPATTPAAPVQQAPREDRPAYATRPTAPLPVREAPTAAEAAREVAGRAAALGVRPKEGEGKEGKQDEKGESDGGAPTSQLEGAQPGQPPPLTSDDPATAAASTIQTPPATLAGYGAARHTDAALASALAGRYRKPETFRG